MSTVVLQQPQYRRHFPWFRAANAKKHLSSVKCPSVIWYMADVSSKGFLECTIWIQSFWMAPLNDTWFGKRGFIKSSTWLKTNIFQKQKKQEKKKQHFDGPHNTLVHNHCKKLNLCYGTNFLYSKWMHQMTLKYRLDGKIILDNHTNTT